MRVVAESLGWTDFRAQSVRFFLCLDLCCHLKALLALGREVQSRLFDFALLSFARAMALW
jgi:hypothetical protein